VTDREVLQRFRQVLAAAGPEEPAPRTPGCLDDDVIAALAEGSVEPAVRAAALPHLAECARCRAAMASVARALADPDVGREVAALEAGGHGRLWRATWIAVPLAAASVVLMLSWPPPRDADSRHRAPTITAAQAPVPVSPIGAVADARRLVWTTTVGADRYRVTLFDSAGSVAFETELGDTTTLVPDSVALAGGRRYLWKVEARTDLGRWTASDLVDFSVPGGARR
jgi:hypothetical protein